MTAKLWSLSVVLALFAVPARAQESVRDLGGPGSHSKFLTHNQLDRWIFEGEKGETIIAHVASREFDPILELAKVGEKEGKLLQEVDDPGNESRFSFRLPETAKYEIRVHAFKYQGGGNYTLQVQRFRARPLAVGKPTVATFDREGKSYHYFPGAKDQILVPDLKGVAPEAWKVLDFKGREIRDWGGTVHIEDDGECCLIVSGPRDYSYDLLIREARRFDLTEGKEQAGTLQPGELAVWSFPEKPGAFRVIEIEKKGEVLSRLIPAPAHKSQEQRIATSGSRPELTFLPVASRSGRVRYAPVFGADGRYQLQLLAQTAVTYKLTIRDPSEPIAQGKEVDGTLPVNGTAFYTFKATPGQLFRASLASRTFVPVLRLFDSQGNQVANSGDDGDALEGHISHMVVTEGLYRLQVASLGDGGGGDFRLALKETKLKELQVGGRGQGTIQPGSVDFWAFEGKEGQTVFLSVRSAVFEPAVSLRSPDGVPLAGENKGNAATGSLMAIKLPKSGRYTIWVAPQRGAGDYSARLIDGD
ncbi:hypothetical protein [Fimbriiglobus ruber]|uniref:Peptidase C-terminal archaeal/bacterial domain-containing protein n=1 Tax=Fimbriiglobus ruber TaxID=1908690 RepID=A0A225E620_9BACT|nr:hypothetical protein [Fimbriiglobus ruber]OWK38897.1 hypothetical protein FRUB_06402 [Fimbriiglobus ruber]OWK44949.1 hypothetical protein FRUB_01280 [Fimbriiglobus ruber]